MNEQQDFQNSTPQPRNLTVFPERRADASAALISVIEGLTTQVHEMREEIIRHKNELRSEREQLINDVLNKALPDGDAEGHRRYHETVIAKIESQKQFYDKLRLELVKYGLLGLVGFFAVAAWHEFLKGPK